MKNEQSHPAKFKRAAASALHRLGWMTGLSAWRARAVCGGRIIMLHGIDGEYGVAAFEEQLRHLLRHFRVVPLRVLAETIAAGKSPDGMAALTFDDGLRNNFTVAYPLLKKHSAPATFFICPGLIGSGRWIWTHEARARLGFLDAAGRLRFLAECNAECGARIESVMDWLKRLPLQRRLRAEERLHGLTADFEPTETERRRFDLMTWEELRALDPDLITIGSHTDLHSILPPLSTDELACALGGSRRRLEEELGRAVEFFCYPNGAFNDAVLEETRRFYRAAVTTRPGFARAGTDPHLLPRIGVVADTPYFAWRMHRPTA